MKRHRVSFQSGGPGSRHDNGGSSSSNSSAAGIPDVAALPSTSSSSPSSSPAPATSLKTEATPAPSTRIENSAPALDVRSKLKAVAASAALKGTAVATTTAAATALKGVAVVGGRDRSRPRATSGSEVDLTLDRSAKSTTEVAGFAGLFSSCFRSYLSITADELTFDYNRGEFRQELLLVADSCSQAG